MFWSFVDDVNVKYESFHSCSFEMKFLRFGNSHAFTHLRVKHNETNELYKQEKGNRKIKNSAAVFVGIHVLVALGPV